MDAKTDLYLEKIEQAISQLPLDIEPTDLYAPVDYSLKNGGKRIRPLMTLLACELFGGNLETALPPAVGLELFHNFTLMHDDIMDAAPVRRGQPTVHARWNTNTAILSGDVLFALAYKYISNVPDQFLRQVMALFNKTVIEVCEGQQYDMDFETTDTVSSDEYIRMIRLKTAVLPAACLQTGAIVAVASAEDQANIYSFGENIGLAFQLRDDWLDVFGEAHKVGKKTGGDIVANKKTWLYIHALDKADNQQRQLLMNAFMNRIDNEEEKIRLVKSVYDQLGISQLAQDVMQVYYTRAFEFLQKIRQPEAKKDNLRNLATALFHRNQ